MISFSLGLRAHLEISVNLVRRNDVFAFYMGRRRPDLPSIVPFLSLVARLISLGP